MTVATPIQAYATVVEADIFLANNSVWIALTNAVKEDALLWGRYFIDSNFDCVVDTDLILEEVKFANSLLANDYYAQGDLFFDNQKPIKKTFVKAGKVETEKIFGTALIDKPNSMSKVVAVLKTVCGKTTGRLTRV